MDIGKLAERMMAMDDATWERHANPWSGWTRITILPLFCLAIWSRVWLGWYAILPIVLVAFWTWLNPRLFGPPATLDAWMTKGVMGERIWLARATKPIAPHHLRVTKLLNIANGVAVVILVIGLWRLDFGLMLAGLVGSMGGKLWFLDRMVWLKQDTDARDAEKHA